MREYRELPPPAALAEAIECCWTASPAQAGHRVVPDGCADIVFRVRDDRPEILAVGAMTRFEDVADGAALGVRFRPGMWAHFLRVAADELTDQTIPLEDLWGARARSLRERVCDARSDEERARILVETAMHAVGARTPVQRAIGAMEKRRGLVSLDWVAREAGLSARHFRRVAIRETGLSPKLLARILRFRHAESRVVAESGDHAGLAAECGFADQAHMIAEFKRFAGRTPSVVPASAVTEEST
jgi:AraC-like DNA-binding protein